jgi:hypothetical protein
MNYARIVRFHIKKIEKNKSEYEERLSGELDRARLIEYKSSIFPTVSSFLSEKNRVLLKNANKMTK